MPILKHFQEMYNQAVLSIYVYFYYLFFPCYRRKKLTCMQCQELSKDCPCNGASISAIVNFILLEEIIENDHLQRASNKAVKWSDPIMKTIKLIRKSTYCCLTGIKTLFNVHFQRFAFGQVVQIKNVCWLNSSQTSVTRNQ